MKKIFKTVLLLLFVLLLAAYAGGAFFFGSHFLPKTSINGVDVSFKDSVAADSAVSAVDPVITITQKEKDGKEPVSEDLHINDLTAEPLVYHTDELLQSQNRYLWFLSLFQPNELTCAKITGTADSRKIQDAVKKLYCLQQQNIISPSDAHIELQDGDPAIIKENDGCQIGEEQVSKAVTEALDRYLKGETVDAVDLTDLYDKAKIRDNDPDLVRQLDELKAVADKKITIVISEDTSVTLEGKQMKDMLLLENGFYVVNEDALADYVAALTGKYNVSDHEYIDRGALKNSLRNALTSTANSSVKATWVTVTNKLVEVDISEQTLWYYENGELIFSSPVVTGNADFGTGTPTGTYYVRRMKSPNTLRGADYVEYVDYWIGWDNDGGHIFGFHDASWRNGEFGGDIWLTNPSHGCVNMPTDKAAQLYNSVEIGTEVYIHN
ncbi:MAG: L,D-transpeptidase [Erysipelotrichaceae bacterium]|nr:L,D-transpeptidase [Erysipelotrichaceae bacterium]